MFYQFEKPPVYFNQPAYQRAMETGYAPQLAALQAQSDELFVQKRAAIRAISTAPPKDAGVNAAGYNGNASADNNLAMSRLRDLDAQARELRAQTKAVLEKAGADPKSKES